MLWDLIHFTRPVLFTCEVSIHLQVVCSPEGLVLYLSPFQARNETVTDASELSIVVPETPADDDEEDDPDKPHFIYPSDDGKVCAGFSPSCFQAR